MTGHQKGIRYNLLAHVTEWLILHLPVHLQPYTITVANITQWNVDQIPSGLSRFTILKPLAVNMSMAVHPAANPDVSIHHLQKTYLSTRALCHVHSAMVILPDGTAIPLH
jgi:hypothetical protein